MESRIVDALLKYRFACFFLGLVITAALSMGYKDLYMDGDYKAFFYDDDPQMLAYENLQRDYTRSENLHFLVSSKARGIFDHTNLRSLYDITEQMWQAPYATRVDSIINFQLSTGDQNGLIVEDLIGEPSELSDEDLGRIQSIAVNHKQLINSMISADAKSTLITISMDTPYLDTSAPADIQAAQRATRQQSFSQIGEYAQQIKTQIQAENSDLDVYYFGTPVVNHTLNFTAERDAKTLIPLMYVVIALALLWFFRSLGSVIGAITIIALSTIGGMGGAGLLGAPITSITIISPIIILTIAVCDSVHLQVIYLRYLAEGKSPLDAMRHSLAVNLHPIILTSVTTTIGFLTLNYSDSPNFRNLGNISAIGVLLAMALTLLVLPAISLLLVKKGRMKKRDLSLDNIASLIINRSKLVFSGSIIIGLLLVSMIPLNNIDDDPATYFQKGIPYRDAIEFAKDTLPAVKNLDFSLSCGNVNCVHEPAYQAKLKAFGDWAKQQEGVVFVNTYVDVISRLNMNMHGDSPEYERLPDSKALAAQYHLLYEMSLPEGLDLNNQISFDQSASRINVLLERITTGDFIQFEAKAAKWFDDNAPELKTPGASIYIMFAALGERTIQSMIKGGVIAMIAVTLVILIAIKSLKYGLLSMVPNSFPALIALGIWGLTVSEINMAGAVVFSITLGLVVDNTVHFMSKYMRSLEETKAQQSLNPNQPKLSPTEQTDKAIRYAFSTVGPALLVTTGVLATGFALLTLSNFNINAYMGGLTAITIVVALIFDFLVLPSLLKIVER